MKTPTLFHPLLSKATLLLTSIALISLLSGCGKDKDEFPGKIKIVAAENFYGEVAQAVGGDLVHVVSLLTSPDMDPHDFEPTPQASKDVDAAQIVIYNGIGYDEWMAKIIKASGGTDSKTVIAIGSDIMGKKEGDNEHLWYNPETFPKYAKVLAENLSKLDPLNADTYAKQADAYIATLAPATELAKELKQATAIPIAVSEPVFDYMAEALNLTVTDKKFELAAEEGADPAPADVAKLQDDIKAKKIKMFVYNTQSSSTTIQNMVALSKENGIPIIEVTETLPKDKNYIQWMTDILNQIKAALK
ncbi:metal ABC transporter substrate-binding protein [Paenibacillus psychroresistens]|uniref:Metal ABC transporter substrate-binding protein n=1 Tax=Paenibacillus psychroresistens TaxID=1778678 RepID=A0A6B8RIW9_9BACL|nr:zinc ABC transporter substrate-binding protein [Paenibacillus psychroresistens]QGQ96401.1 metal ABC transporter substrate-binding protein [Paenibacillus psychroresistens]